MSNLQSTLSIKLIDDVSTPAGKIAAALKNADAQVKALAAAGVSSKLGASLTRLGASAAEIQKVGGAWKDYVATQKLAANASDWTRAQASSVRTWEAATVSAVRNVMREEEAQARLQQRVADQQRHAIEQQVRQQRAMEQHASMASRARRVAGNAAMFAGPAILHGTKAAAESGAEIQSAKVKMASAGIPASEISAAYDQSIGLAAKYQNVGVSAILERYKELRSVLTRPEETPHLLETVVKANAALNAIDRTGEMGEGLQFAVKGAEITGRAQDPEKFARYLEAFVKAQQVMGKTITPEQQYEMAKYFRASSAGLSDRFLNTTALSLGQEMGSTGAVGVDQLIKQVVGGFQGSQHAAAKEFVALGLAKKDDFETTKTGEIKGLKTGRHVAGSELAQSDPDKWIYQYVLPALRAHGYTSLDQQIGELRRLFPNGRAADVVTKFIQQQQSYENHAKLYGEAGGFGALGGGDAFVALDKFGKSLTSFAGVLTSPVMPAAAEALSGLSSWIGSLTEHLAAFQKTHPLAATIAGGGALAGGLGVGSVLTYNLLSGMMGGFGLKASAVALDGSAAALDAAAAKLAGGNAVADAAKVGGAGAAGGAAAGAAGIASGIANGVLGAGVLAAGGMKYDSEHGNTVRSWLREKLGIADPNEPAPWMPGGDWHKGASPDTTPSAKKIAEIYQRTQIPTTSDFTLGAQGGFRRAPTVTPRGFNAFDDEAAKQFGGPTDLARRPAAAPVPALDLSQVEGQAGEGQAAGQRIGQAIRAGLAPELQGAVEDARRTAQQIINALTFSASPDITPLRVPTTREHLGSLNDSLHGVYGDTGFGIAG